MLFINVAIHHNVRLTNNNIKSLLLDTKYVYRTNWLAMTLAGLVTCLASRDAL